MHDPSARRSGIGAHARRSLGITEPPALLFIGFILAAWAVIVLVAASLLGLGPTAQLVLFGTGLGLLVLRIVYVVIADWRERRAERKAGEAGPDDEPTPPAADGGDGSGHAHPAGGGRNGSLPE